MSMRHLLVSGRATRLGYQIGGEEWDEPHIFNDAAAHGSVMIRDTAASAVTAGGDTYSPGYSFVSSAQGVLACADAGEAPAFSLTPSLTSVGLISGSYAVQVQASGVLTANRALSFAVGNADRTITLSGNPTLADWFDQSVKAAASPSFAGLTVNTYAVTVNGAVTLNNWFDQSVKQSASPTFVGVTAAQIDSASSMLIKTTAVQTIRFGINSTVAWTLGTDHGLVNTSGSGYVAVGASPAGAGAVRLPNNTYVRWKNAAGNDQYGLYLSASDVLTSEVAFSAPTVTVSGAARFDGQMSFGAAPNANALLTVGGTFSPASAANVSTALRFVPTINGYAGASIYGALFNPTLVEAASGNHALIAAAAFISPTITAGVATVTDAATVYIDAATTATVTGANYALWVDAGVSRFDGALSLASGIIAQSGQHLSLLENGNRGWTVQNATGHIYPDADASRNIGSASYRADQIFARYINLGTTPATIGAVRIPHGVDGVIVRNQANSADYNVVSVGNLGNNRILIGDSNMAGVDLAASTSHVFYVGGTAIATIGSTYFSVGTTPSTTGEIRVPNNGGFYGRNAANTGNLRAIRIDSADRIIIGDGSNANLLLYPGSSNLIQIGGTTSSQPALKQSSATLQVRLADDSNYADFVANSVTGNAYARIGASNYSTTGGWRAPNGIGYSVRQRNAANSSDINVAGLTSSDDVQVGESGIPVTVPGALRVGTNYATSGAIRMANATSINGRDAANSANLTMIEITSGNIVGLGDGGTPVIFNYGFTYYGGTTSSFPALKRSAAQLHTRKADDSGFAEHFAANFWAEAGGIVGFSNRTGLQATAAGKVQVYDASGGTRSWTADVSQSDAWGTKLETVGVTLADSATATIGAASSTWGLLCVTVDSDEKSMICFLNGTNNSVNIISDPFNLYSNTGGTGSKINVYYSGGNYIIENKRGGSRLIRATFIR